MSPAGRRWSALISYIVPERKPRFLVGWVEPLDFVGFRASTQPTKINQLKELNLLGRNPTNRFNGFSFRHYIDFKIKILDALSVVNVRRVRLPPSSTPSHKFCVPNWQNEMSSKWLHLIHLSETGNSVLFSRRQPQIRISKLVLFSRRKPQTNSNDQNLKITKH